MPLFTLANLSGEQLQALQEREKETGKKVLALQTLKVQPEELEDKELSSLQELEQEMDMTLVAVQ